MPSREKLLKFLEINNFDAMFENLTTKVVDLFRTGCLAVGQQMPDGLAEIVDKTCRERRSIFEDKLVSIYNEHLTDNDLDTLIAFHESETGRRMASLGKVIQDSFMNAEETWSNDTIKSMDAELHKLLDFAEPAESETPAEPSAA